MILHYHKYFCTVYITISLNNDFNFYQWACKIRKKIPKKNVLPLQRLLHNIALSFNLYHINKKKKTYQAINDWVVFFAERPRFQVLPKNMTIYEGHPAMLHCVAIGDPRPDIHWDKNYFQDIDSSRIKVSVCSCVPEYRILYLRLMITST